MVFVVLVVLVVCLSKYTLLFSSKRNGLSSFLATIDEFRIIWRIFGTIANLSTNQHPTLAAIPFIKYDNSHAPLGTGTGQGPVQISCLVNRRYIPSKAKF